MPVADLFIGYSLLALLAVIFPYLLVWIYVLPFVPQDSFIRLAFPSQFLALLIPLVSFTFVLLCMGIFAFALFIGHKRMRFRVANKEQSYLR